MTSNTILQISSPLVAFTHSVVIQAIHCDFCTDLYFCIIVFLFCSLLEPLITCILTKLNISVLRWLLIQFFINSSYDIITNTKYLRWIIYIYIFEMSSFACCSLVNKTCNCRNEKKRNSFSYYYGNIISFVKVQCQFYCRLFAILCIIFVVSHSMSIRSCFDI